MKQVRKDAGQQKYHDDSLPYLKRAISHAAGKVGWRRGLKEIRRSGGKHCLHTNLIPRAASVGERVGSASSRATRGHRVIQGRNVE